MKCENCGKEFEEEKLVAIYTHNVGEVRFVCEECAEELIDKGEIAYCHETGDLYVTEDMVFVEDISEWVSANVAEASNKYWQCDDCGKWFTRNGVYRDGIHTVCDHCYDWNDWTTCDRCGTLIPYGEAHWYDDEPYCSDCYEQVSEGARLHDYFYKPDPNFHASFGEATKLYYGVELETDEKGRYDRGDYVDALYDVSDDQNYFYMKEDGSLERGVEIVTHPCSLSYHLNKFPWQKITDVAKSYEFLSHDTSTCGLHVHVSRDALGATANEQDLTVAKIILLVDRLWDKMVKFSRRRYDALDQWARKPDADIMKGDSSEEAISKSKRTGVTRYRAVNLTNASTIEFRMFRGTLKVNTIKATLEFLDNLVNFAKSHTLAETQDATWNDVVGYRRYEELDTYLAERGLAPASQDEITATTSTTNW